MTWNAVLVAGVVFAIALAFGGAAGIWLAKMAQRGHHFWPLAVVLPLAFAAAVGIAAVVTQVAP